MSREILFRGKRVDSGEWLEGQLVSYWWYKQESHLILQNGIVADLQERDLDCKVDPKTIGQYTGLKDKNGVRIFEGDCFDVLFQDMFNSTLIAKENGVVVFRNGIYWVEFMHPIEKKYHISALYVFLEKNPKEIIGNIHEDK